MKRYLFDEVFDIYTFETDTWPHPVHNHTYYEIIFITKGSGNHVVNDNKFQYAKGDVFYLGPEDYHFFEIRSLTRFSYIRFNESLFQSRSETDREWKKIMKELLTPGSVGAVVHGAYEKGHLHQLLHILEKEYDNRHSLYFTSVRDGILKAILSIIARNVIHSELPQSPPLAASVADILQYIRKNIRQPGLLRLENLADRFNYSASYLGTFFKKHTGESLKEFIVRQRLKQIETRLIYSSESLAEITEEFGFTDESHLCKQFKKYKGVSPVAFRRG